MIIVGKTGDNHLTLKLTHSHSLLHNREEGLIQIHEPNFMVTSPGVSSPDVRTYFHHDSTKRLNHNATLPSSFLNRSTSLVASLLAPSTSF